MTTRIAASHQTTMNAESLYQRQRQRHPTPMNSGFPPTGLESTYDRPLPVEFGVGMESAPSTTIAGYADSTQSEAHQGQSSDEWDTSSGNRQEAGKSVLQENSRKRESSAVENPPHEESSPSQNGKRRRVDVYASQQEGEEPNTIPPSDEGLAFFGDNDVLSGRGGGTNVHPGNRHFRDLVNLHRRSYLKARKNDKPNISRAIVRAIRDNNGRFLKRDEKSGLWYEIGDDAAREKTSQALRQRAPEMRRILQESELEQEAVFKTNEETAFQHPQGYELSQQQHFVESIGGTPELTSLGAFNPMIPPQPGFVPGSGGMFHPFLIGNGMIPAPAPTNLPGDALSQMAHQKMLAAAWLGGGGDGGDASNCMNRLAPKGAAEGEART